MRRCISLVLAFLMIFGMQVTAQAYLLTDEERHELERAVMAEASNDFYGQALIAECALNTTKMENCDVITAIHKYQWTPRRVEPSDSCVWAVKAVFDYGYEPSGGQPITIFYNPKLCTSLFHESQTCIQEWNNVRFFAQNVHLTQILQEEYVMNNIRRNKIKSLLNDLNAINNKVEDILDEEEDAYNNLPDQLQDTANGIAMSETIEALEDAIDQLESIEDILTNII